MSYDSGPSGISFNTSEAVAAIEEALTLVKDNLTEFVASETFEADMVTVFGDSANVELAETIIEGLAIGDELPEITVVPVEEMNGANGGYDPLTGEVYLADGLLKESSQQVADVLMEEFGHLLDSEINEFDTTGDEGEYFAAVVSGDDLSEEEIERLRGEDDTVTILNGVEVEANSEISFSNAINFDVENDPGSVAVGDFNGDRKLDLAVTNYYSQNVSVLFGNGNGIFSKAANYPVGNYPRSVAVGEFNGDRISDLAVANASSDNVSVLLGNGDASFSNATNFDVEDNPRSVAVGEFNGDGISDLVVANNGSGKISVLLGNGNGSFSNTNFDAEYGSRSVAVGDFNGDGISDLVVGNRYYDKISVLLGNGDGSFNNATNFDAGDDPSSVAVGDFNRDGISDVAVANAGSDNVSVLLGNGDASFSNATNFDVGNRPESVVIGDFNRDRLPDLAVANAASNNLSILLNTSPVTIAPPNINISNTAITEGNKGRKNAKFAVTLDSESDKTVKVNYATADRTAKAGKDYRKTNGTLTFKPGQTQKTVTIPILGDTLEEGNEKFKVNLSKPKNGKLGDKSGIGTIRDNDKVVPQLSIGDARVTEGDDGSKKARFAVTLNAKADKTVRVNYATGNGTADAGEDYRRTKGTLTFKPGQRRKTITVPVFGDIIDEKNEKFQVTLSKPRNAKLGDKRGIGNIRDND